MAHSTFPCQLARGFFQWWSPFPKKKTQGNHSCGSVLWSDGPMQKSCSCLNHSGWIVLLNLKLIALLLGAGSAIPQKKSASFHHSSDVVTGQIKVIKKWCDLHFSTVGKSPRNIGRLAACWIAGSSHWWNLKKTLVKKFTSTKYSTSQVQDWVIACTYGILWGSNLHNFG